MTDASHKEPFSLSRGIQWSLIAHLGIASFILIKSLIFPGTPVQHVPVLRVDVVGLPDILKKDLGKIAPPPAPRAEEKTTAAPPKKPPPEEVAKPDELVLKPKKTVTPKRTDLSAALTRIKALEKIRAAEDQIDAPKVVKGNQISPGSSLTGDARESAEASYYDAVLDRVRTFWSLPIWLARQNYSAQVQVFILPSGALQSFKFIQASGNPQFDEFVRQAVQDSAPFPPPPNELRSTVLGRGILLGFPL